MPNSYAVKRVDCCGIPSFIAVVRDEQQHMLVGISTHGISESELTKWVRDNHEAVKQLVDMCKERCGRAKA